MARKPKQTKFWDSLALNNATYGQYYRWLTELAISMFEWQNLPDTVDARFLELILFSTGQAVFFKDEVMGYLGLRCIINGPLDVYRNPINRRAVADNGYNNVLTNQDSVIIYNNLLRQPSEPDVSLYSRRLYNIDRIIDVNVNAQKTPVMITCDETERLTMQNLYMQYDGNEPVIFGKKGLTAADKVGVLKTDAPYISDKLYILKSQMWNEALTHLGISNISAKKGNMVTAEVARAQGGTVASRYSRLTARQQACEQINRMFDLDIWCEYREDFSPLEDEIDDTEPAPKLEVDNFNE